MADVASLNLEVKSDSVEQSTVRLRDQTKAASAAERAAQKWGMATNAAGRSSEDFSKRVQGTIRNLEFERQQLTRNAAQQERYAALRRAGVTAASAEGQAITASVMALQAQRAASEAATKQSSAQVAATRAASTAWGSLKGVLGPVAAALSVAAIATKIWDSAMEVADFGEKADQIGTTVETMQALQYAAVQNGIGFEQLDGGIGKFSQKIGEAAEGSKEMIEALQRLNVNILGANGSLRPTEDILFEVAKKITSIDDPARRAAAAVDFFGKAGMKMIPLLAEMSKGQDAFVDASQRAGAIVGDETVAKLDKFADRLSASGLKWRATFATIAAKAVEFAEGIQAAWNRILPMDKASMQKRRDAWQRPLEDFFDWIGDSFRSLIAKASGWAAGIAEAFSGIGDALESVFRDAMNKAIGAIEKGLNVIQRGLNKVRSWFSNDAPSDPVNLGRLDPSGKDVSAGALNARVAAKQQAAEQAALAAIPSNADARARQRFIERQVRMQADEDAARSGKLPSMGPPAGGVSNPAVKGGGSDPYAKAIESAKEYVLTKRAETEAIGKNALEAARLKHEQELLNKAMGDGKTITEAQKAALQGLAAQMAAADNELATAKFMDDAKTKSEEFIANQELEARSLFMTAEAAAKLRYETELLNEARRQGIELTPEKVAAIQADASAMAAAEARTKQLREAFEFAKSTTTEFFADIRNGLLEGQTIWEAFGNAAVNALTKISDKLFEIAANKLVEQAFGGLGGGGGGGGLFGFIGGLFGGGGVSASGPMGIGDIISGAGGLAGGWMPGFAKGAAFKAGNVVPFANGGVVSAPTTFPMARGRTGVMGEAGPEAIMPLRRGADGRLGIEAANSNGRQSGRVDIYIHDATEMLNLTIDNRADVRIARASPKIVKSSTSQSRREVKPTIDRHHAEQDGEWRGAA